MKGLPAFYGMVRKCSSLGHRPIFVVAPDVPYDMAKSRVWSAKHTQHLRQIVDWPVAIAVQDGAVPDDLDGYQAVFVAGSTEWKWRTAAMWVREAHARSMWAHVARVNNGYRIEHCQDIGADSADGTGIFRGCKKQLAGVLNALVQPALFQEVACENAL